jgi:hypothetical protein
MYHEKSVEEKKEKKSIQGQERIKKEVILIQSKNARIFQTKAVYKINYEAV